MRAAALLAGLALTLSTVALADEAEDARSARAEYQKGQAEYNLGNYAEAAKFFEEAYRIKAVPALLFNIAQAYRFAGNLEKAVQTYRAYLRTAPATDSNVSRGKELLEQVEAALSSKQKAEASPPHGLAPGATTAPAGATSATPAPPVEPGPRVYTWVAGGAAALALAGGAYFGSKSKSDLSELQTGYHDKATIDSQTASAKSDAGKANAMLALGAALAVAGGVLFVLHF